MITKRGLSGVVTVVILIGLAVAMISIIWIVVRGLVTEKLDESQCLETIEKVSINEKYTCYDSTAGDLDVSLIVGDVDINGINILVYGSGSSRTFKLTDGLKNVPGIESYKDGCIGDDGACFDYTLQSDCEDDLDNYECFWMTILEIRIPTKDSGWTYVVDTSTGIGEPDYIEIAPVIGESSCGVTDTLADIDNCLAP